MAVSERALSSVLVREERTQHPVYYVSKLLRGAETRYTPLEKMAYALVTTARKLVPYFQAHPKEVLTDQPLAGILRNPMSSGRMMKWAIELTQYGIEYRPRPSIKAQALADFIVECTTQDRRGKTNNDAPDEWWELNADGAASAKHCGGGIMLTTPEGFKVYYSLEYQFKVSNNEAEYEAVIGGIRLAVALGARNLRIKTDSRLVVGQMKGTFETRGENLKMYKDVTEGLLEKLKAHEIQHVPRTENVEADLMSKISLGGVPRHLSQVCRKEIIYAPSTESLVVASVTSTGVPPLPKWMEEFTNYITKGELPLDPTQAAKIKRRAPAYRLEGSQLYKKSFGGPLLKCLQPSEAEQVIEEAHKGICAAHQGANTLARKLLIQGYYWPNTVHDCIQKVQNCHTCQKFAEKQDNRRQFDSKDFSEFCKNYGIQHTKVSVAYPQANGLVENANRTIMDGLKKRIEEERGAWVDQLDYILWAYRTTPRRATGETPFSLTNGFEAKVPIEVLSPTDRTLHYEDQANEQMMQLEKNFLEERRDVAQCRMVEYQRAVKKYHDARVKPKYCDLGDLVLRDRQASQPNQGGKVAKNWEGPYRIAAIARPGTYKLKTMEGKAIDRIWNSSRLKKFYQ
ncbi:uncharacterized protein LOC116029776 [Ipomoea triloba]|uniref:uncharacterized protein LOC116029776 n=1 Tax=Ipomoea triloba TaxID=35885 RepID=UPI00125E712A|nr:uncharacterized protein LOC116029776 [Ipomoea triloba]